MNATTQNKLADALRALLENPGRDDCGIQGCGMADCACIRADFANKAARAALAEHDAQPAPTCPHCARTLAGAELARGLCGSDDCPRHDAAKALRALVETFNGERWGAKTKRGRAIYAAREALAEYPDLPASEATP